jgi:hypothetical protein
VGEITKGLDDVGEITKVGVWWVKSRMKQNLRFCLIV